MYAKGRTNTTFVHVQVEWASYTECLMPWKQDASDPTNLHLQHYYYIYFYPVVEVCIIYIYF